MEKDKAKASKVRTKKNRKIVRKSDARPDSDLSSSDDATIHSDDDSPPSPRRQKKSKIRLAPITAPPEKLKPLTALPMPPLPPELRKDLKIDTEAHKAILLGTKGKRRKSEESSSGLKQLTLAAFTTPSSSSSGRLSLGSSGNTSSTKKASTNN
ncbi:hypothetical protein QCA50_003123 [Cerrena zonata]|uniref:Uncharacterized protein n=1 Tax=Cerrena zonata TaxID=2478898 RepID=A0AAW0GNY6_9APHY